MQINSFGGSEELLLTIFYVYGVVRLVYGYEWPGFLSNFVIEPVAAVIFVYIFLCIPRFKTHVWMSVDHLLRQSLRCILSIITRK